MTAQHIHRHQMTHVQTLEELHAFGPQEVFRSALVGRKWSHLIYEGQDAKDPSDSDCDPRDDIEGGVCVCPFQNSIWRVWRFKA